MRTIHRLATGIAALSLLSLASAALAQDAAAPVDPAAAKAAAKARAKQVAAWKAQYGPGPYPDEIEAFAQTREEKLRGYYRVLYYDGEHNAVLNYERLGLLSMELGYYGDAEKAFDGALDRIEAFYNKDKQAEKATSATRLEVNKDFKGEPYERAMAYYYRGLLYLRKGDYDNARASFKAAEYQDTVSGEETFQSDFALLTYLQGWASHCAGDGSQAADAFEQAAKVDAKLKAPGPNDNLLVLTELGAGPVKATDGQYQEKLVFRPGAAMPENGAIVTLGSGKMTRAWPLIPAADVYTQASTRGGRAIDGILDGKAQFKAGLETTSALATTVGSSFAQQMGGNALYAQGIGAALSMFSKSVRPTADTRMWDGLPSTILVGTTRWGAAAPPPAAAKGKKKAAPKPSALTPAGWSMPPVSLTYRHDDNGIDLTGTKPMSASAGKCGIAWARSRSVESLPPEAPGNNAKIALARKKDKDAWAKDEAFRAKLR
jgi:tetratricopeptide (TPR) repeat protein